MDNTEEQRTIWCGNLSEKVTEELLYELFLQAGPVQRVKIPLDREGRQNTYAFITFKHTVSVPYATQLLNGIALFARKLNLKPRTSAQQPHVTQQPVQIPQIAPSISEINKLMFLGSMMKSHPKITNVFENHHTPIRRDRNYGIHKDNRRIDKPYAHNYRGRNQRENYEIYRGNNLRSFYSNGRQRH